MENYAKSKIYFDKVNADKKRRDKVKVMEEKFKDKFKSEEELKEFIKINMERKLRNTIVRRTRLMRKVNLQEWNYICFTYDDKKCDEKTFRLSFVLVELKRNPHFKQGKKIVKDMKQKDYNTIFF